MAENLVQIQNDYNYIYYLRNPSNENEISDPLERDNFLRFKSYAAESQKKAYQALELVEDEGLDKGINILLDKRAEESFDIELGFYNALFGEQSNFVTTVKAAFSTKKPNYMSAEIQQGNQKQTLYQALVYKVLGIEDKDQDNGKWNFINIISSLSLQDIASNAIADPRKVVESILRKSITGILTDQKMKRISVIKNIDNLDAVEIANQIVVENLVFSNKALEDENVLRKLVTDALRKGQYPVQLARRDNSDIVPIIVENIQRMSSDWVEQMVEQIKIYLRDDLDEEQIRQLVIGMLTKQQGEANTATLVQSGVIKSENPTIVQQAGLKKTFDSRFEALFNSSLFSSGGGEGEIQSVITQYQFKETDPQLQGMMMSFHKNILSILSKRGGGVNGAIEYYQSIMNQIDKEVYNDLMQKIANSGLKEETEYTLRAFTEINDLNTMISFLSEFINNLNDSIKLTDTIKEKLKDIAKKVFSKHKAITIKEKGGEINISYEEFLSFFDKPDAQAVLEIQKYIPYLQKRLEASVIGFVSNIQGSIGEIIYPILLRITLGEGYSVAQLGRSTNESGQQEHGDITVRSEGAKFAIQSKIYKNNDLEIYKDTSISLSNNDAQRYFGSRSGLDAFRYFLVNNTCLSEIGLVDNNIVDENGSSKGVATFQDVLRQRVDYFIRYSDGLNKDALKNNFYMINFNLVPSSAIFFLLKDAIEKDIKETNSKKMFKFNYQEKLFRQDSDEYKKLMTTTGDYPKISDNLNILENDRVTFSGLTIKLTELGGSIFNK